MINFDIFSTKDSFGFTRLCNVPGIDKFVELFTRMDVTTPCNPNSALYKDYTVKVYSLNYGELDFEAICQADMFFRRVSKYFPTGWHVISKIDDNGNRTNEIIYISKYRYQNMPRCNMQGFEVMGLNTSFKSVSFIVNVNDIKNIVIRPLTNDEIKICEEYRDILEINPEPIYSLMEMKQEYKDDYNIYLADCEKYGFTPLDKFLIERVSLTYGNYQTTTFTKDGTFGGYDNDDTIIVNKNE